MNGDLPLIPKPSSIKIFEGEFILNEKTIIVVDGKETQSDAEVFNSFLKNIFGIQLRIMQSDLPMKNIILLQKTIADDISADTYKLHVQKDRVSIRGKGAGVFYGLQTLLQLIHQDKKSFLQIQCLSIDDSPRYKWRGMHLDVCRHFFPKEEVMKYIDHIAMYKMNTFHWHLTEDQGWRIEIKKYPRLTEDGAWRNGTMQGHYSEQRYDTIRYGGFYSQDDVKEIAAYANKRHVTIVPEIEMPGHCLAALAAYPQYSCTGGPFEVAKGWGVFDDVYCPKEETFKFLENVLSEVCDLFPGKYIHIGGDECPKVRWKNCSHCQQLMKREGLKDEHELQSYFVQRIEKFLNSKGKQIIGWDEILEGGLAPNAAVMSWRGTDGGIAAAKEKHNVVMTPGSHCYFDHYQGNPEFEPLAIGGYTTVEKVYSYEPAPTELSEEEKKYVMGAQGNVWTEYIPDFAKVEYMALPRMCALAEVLWSPVEQKNENEFLNRLTSHFNLLDRLGINYSKAMFAVNATVSPADDNEGVKFSLTTRDSIADIRYTIDESEPTDSSAKYISSLKIKTSSIIKAAQFVSGKKMSGILTQRFVITKSTGKKIVLDYLPSEKYNKGGAFTLVNGVSGGDSWNGMVYLGFDTTDLSTTIDLGTSSEINKVTMGFAVDEGSWIHLPSAIEIFISEDGKNFSQIKNISSDEIKKQGRIIVAEIEKTKARFVKVIAHRVNKIPEGKPGAGENAWLFADEIMVE